jgi:hypothetical protein
MLGISSASIAQHHRAQRRIFKGSQIINTPV